MMTLTQAILFVPVFLVIWGTLIAITNPFIEWLLNAWVRSANEDRERVVRVFVVEKVRMRPAIDDPVVHMAPAA